MSDMVMTHARNLAWRDQHETYGAQFADIYDQLFPAGDGLIVAEYLLDLIAPGHQRELAEFGVGTGRVALPLARAGATVHGVDSSAELLAQARRRAAGLPVRLEQGDLRQWAPPRRVPVAYCVCATLSMLPDRAAQFTALQRMADAITEDGVVVVETHSPARVHRLHGERAVVEFTAPVSGVAGGMRCRSELDAGRRHWRLEHRWSDGGERRAEEFSLLTSPEQLVDLAAAAGLRLARLESSWRGASHEPLSPTYIACLRKTTTDGGRTR